MTDGVGELHFATRRQSGSDHILCDVTAHVSSAAIHFARIFTGECAAAMASHAAVTINDNFAAGQAGVALRPADDETAGWID